MGDIDIGVEYIESLAAWADGDKTSLLRRECSSHLRALRAALDRALADNAAAVDAMREAIAAYHDEKAAECEDYDTHTADLHRAYAADIRAITTPAPMTVQQAARVLLDDLAQALATDMSDAGKAAGRRWLKAHDAAEAAPTAMNKPTPIQMIRAALSALTEAKP